MRPDLIPNLDPNPLPAPFWVFKLLLVVTFFLHILAMNAMLGGAILALTAKWRAKEPHSHRLFADIAKKLPSLLPATITIGIAPLLFVQVIYGQFIYTSSIIVAWPWLLVLLFLLIAYYGFYFASFQSGRQPGKAALAMFFSVFLALVIGFTYSNNFTLAQNPTQWAQKYLKDPSGWNLNLAEPSLIPRYLHFVVAAIAVGGLLLMFLAASKWRTDREYADEVLRFGGKAFLYATMAQFVVGFWFLFSLPRDIRMIYLGDYPLASGLLAVGVAAAIGAIFLASEALRTRNIRVAAVYLPSVTAVLILVMSVMRELLRDAYLKPYFHPEQMRVETQWSVFPLFLALFVGGVVLWLIMLKRYGLFSGSAGPSIKTSPVAGELK